MDKFLLSRELGDAQASSSLELECTTRLIHSIRGASEIVFRQSHAAGINGLCIEKQNSRFMLSGSANGSIAMWDLDFTPPISNAKHEVELVVSVPRSHKFGISSISFYPPDHDLFITSSYDKTVKVWDTNAMESVCEFDLEVIVYSAVMPPKSFHTLIATSSQFHAIRLLDLNTGGSTHSLIGHIGSGTLGINWSPRDEYILASGGVDGTVRLWDIRRATSCLACLEMNNSGVGKVDGRNLAHHGPVNGITWSEDGTLLVTLGHDDKMRVWNMATGENTLTNFEPLIRNRHNQVLTPVLVPLRMSDPQLIFTPSGSSILGFSLNEGTLVKRFNPPQGTTVNALVQRPYRTEFYSASANGNITAWIPEAPLDEGDGEVNIEKPNTLDTVYRSLIQMPIKFS